MTNTDCKAKASVRNIELLDIDADPSWVIGGRYRITVKLNVTFDLFCEIDPDSNCATQGHQGCRSTVGTAFETHVYFGLIPSGPKIQGCIPELFVTHGLGAFFLCLARHGMSVQDFINSELVDTLSTHAENVIEEHLSDWLCECDPDSLDGGSSDGVVGNFGDKDLARIRNFLKAKFGEIYKKSFRG